MVFGGPRVVPTRSSAPRASWSAAGSKAPRCFRTRHPVRKFNGPPPSESGVAAAHCHRSPKSSRAEPRLGVGQPALRRRDLTSGVRSPPSPGPRVVPTRSGWHSPRRWRDSKVGRSNFQLPPSAFSRTASCLNSQRVAWLGKSRTSRYAFSLPAPFRVVRVFRGSISPIHPSSFRLSPGPRVVPTRSAPPNK